MNADYKNFIVEKCEMCLSNDSFSPDMYAKYDVKKGLRDSHGNGVVVGLTTVSQVNGTKLVNDEKVPAANFVVTDVMLAEGVKIRKGKKVFHKAVLA